MMGKGGLGFPRVHGGESSRCRKNLQRRQLRPTMTLTDCLNSSDLLSRVVQVCSTSNCSLFVTARNPRPDQ